MENKNKANSEDNSSKLSDSSINSFFSNDEVRDSKKNLSVKQAITTLCRAKGWTYVDLSNEVGIQKQTLNNYMNGKWGVPHEIKIKISRALEVDSSVIWGLK